MFLYLHFVHQIHKKWVQRASSYVCHCMGGGWWGDGYLLQQPPSIFTNYTGIGVNVTNLMMHNGLKFKAFT